METGKVKWFNYKKGYGFIKPNQGEKDIFVHITALQAAKLRSLDEDETVLYDLKEENGKICATNLKKSL